MYGYIYITTNLLNNKKYIGKHKSPVFEFDTYIGSGKILLKAIKKDGRKNFKCELLPQINNIPTVCMSEEDLNQAECYYIEYYNCINSEEYYNIAEGGEGGNIGCNIEATIAKAKTRFELLLQRINKDEFILYYKTHNTEDIRTKFSLTVQQYKKLILYYNLSKTKEEINAIIKATVKQKYGVENTFQVETFKNKGKQTKSQRYGNEFYCNKEQADKTRLLKFGCASAFGNKEIQQKSTNTLIQKYGSLENYHKEQHKLAEETCKKRYGDNYMQTIVSKKGRVK